MPHERFRFPTLDALMARIAELGLDLPITEDLSPLTRRVRIGGKETPNALGIHPMEGADGTADGRPDALTVRRYLRLARGGTGLLWFEATAVVHEGRANPRQLLLTPESAPNFARMREEALAAGREEANGPVHGAAYSDPFTVIQLTHAGRYSRPDEGPAPIIAHHDGLLDKALRLSPDHPLIGDDDLDHLQERYVAAARLAHECGFDAVDIKSCHRYLISELLAAHTRPGRYGGPFKNRTRLLLDVVRRVQAEVPGIQVAVRLNVYDGHPYPWGWGVSRDDPAVPDMDEPLRLIGLLREAGVALVNVTAGNPYYTPHINRPFDANVIGGYTPEEHPLVGVTRLVHLARAVKERYPDLVVVGTGYSWLRHHLGHVAAAVIERGWADIVGVGREAFAYPDFARDLLVTGRMNPRAACIACSRCTQIMRDHGRTGCVPFDREVYGPIYEAGRQGH
jgi:2,4-dienoyl-CoA reductase-like NADH-dependent reductase (Old Yellow Enzyme family)